jgi:hypothetical protein
MIRRLDVILAPLLALVAATSCRAECRPTNVVDTEVKIADNVVNLLGNHKLASEDLFRAMHVTSQFETNGCWAGSSNPDAQFLSVGVMQWNLGKRSLQPLLKIYLTHFENLPYRASYIGNLMPTFGAQFFAECLNEAVSISCKNLIYSSWRDLRADANPRLKPDFVRELDSLFNDKLMRQVQMDLYAKAFTASVDDFQNIYHNPRPAYWQQAWAIDVRTQLGRRVLTDNAIRRITGSVNDDAATAFDSIMLWYDSTCIDNSMHINKQDCAKNHVLWPREKARLTAADKDRLITLAFTRRIAEGVDVTAKGVGSDEWKLDLFTRKATIAVGKGYVHGSEIVDPSLR